MSTATDSNTDSTVPRGELTVNDQGLVEGIATVFNDEDGYDVTAVVYSYRYDDGEKINHVPMARLTKPDGRIVHESECHDTENPETAIDRAVSTAEYLLENPEEYLGE